jgi:hypothetical protein
VSGVSIAQLSFTGGEWSPSLDPRTDLAKYVTAARTQRNGYPHPHGGWSNRPGTEFVVETKDSTKVGRLVPFQFSVTQSYVIEFGNLYIRFIKDGGQIVSAKAITGAADNGVGLIRITSASHGFQSLNTVTVASVGGVPNATGTWVITVINANTYDLVGSTFAGVYTTGGTGTAIVEIATTYVEADLPLLKFEQSADTLYVTHPSYPPRKITRTSHTAWTITTITTAASIAAPTGLAGSGAGRTWAVTAVNSTGVESVASSTALSAVSNTLTWNAVLGATEYKLYEVINSIYQYVDRSGTNSYALPATVTSDPEISPPTLQSLFASTDNYPGSCAFFDQRLIFLRTNNAPQTFKASVPGDFENHNTSSPLKDDDAITGTLNTRQVNEIRWGVEVNEDLILGTSGGEFKLSPGSNSDSITPTSAKAKRQSSWGVSDIQPLVIGNSVLFVDGSDKVVRDLLYSLEINGYDGSELTILAQHLFETYSIKEWCYARHPDSIIWCIRTDGTLIGLTYQKEHQVFGWHRHDTDGTFESVASIQVDGGTTEVYVIVKRTVGGVVQRYIEKFHDRVFTDVEDCFFVDCGLSYDGSVAQTLTPGATAITQGATGVTFTAGGGTTFVIGDIGREIHYRYYDEDLKQYHTAKAEITGYTGPTVVTCTILLPFPSAAAIASGDWRLSVLTVSGLDHLQGETVSILADGSYVSGEVVASGAITLSVPASIIHVGLPYTSQLGSLGFDYPTRNGTVQDKIKAIPSVFLKFRNTRAAWVGPGEDSVLDEINFRDDEDAGEPTRLFTGQKEVSIDPGDPYLGRVFIEVTEPLPITVSAIIPNIDNGN